VIFFKRILDDADLRLEAGVADGEVALEVEVELVGGGVDGDVVITRITAKLAQKKVIRGDSISNLDDVEFTVAAGFQLNKKSKQLKSKQINVDHIFFFSHLKVDQFQLQSGALWRREDALITVVVGVVIRVIRRGEEEDVAFQHVGNLHNLASAAELGGILPQIQVTFRQI